MVTCPPVASSEVRPALIITSPPTPLVPRPTDIKISPPFPCVACPVLILISPELPTLVVPVLTLIAPLTPALPELEDEINIMPLDFSVLPPDKNINLPPVPPTADPPVIFMSPPRSMSASP